MELAEAYVNSLVLTKEDIVYEDKLYQTSKFSIFSPLLKSKNQLMFFI